MGLFGPSKVKTTPHDFVKTQLDKIFSADFVDAEQAGFANLSREIPILQKVSPDKYLKERQDVVYSLFQLAWDRTIPYDVFVKYSLIMLDDPRVKEINSGVYHRCLSRAQEAGMDTFGFISRLFISQIVPESVGISEADYSQLYVMYGTNFTDLYRSFEALIKQHKFLT
jgi:hypothetical protein